MTEDRYDVYLVDEQYTYREIHNQLTEETLLRLIPNLVKVGDRLNWTVLIRKAPKLV